MLPVSNDTLLRAVRRRSCSPFPKPTVVGIDDWAWKRNQRYGTIICDLERRRPIRLLPDREPATAQAWLAAQPQIAIVARDRGGAYSLAATKALPQATQVADRWHLMENASHAFLDAVCAPRMEPRSNRSCGRPGIAGDSCAGFCAASVQTYSERAKVLWSRICPGSTRNGPQAFTAAPSFGGV
jgi:transposase